MSIYWYNFFPVFFFESRPLVSILLDNARQKNTHRPERPTTVAMLQKSNIQKIKFSSHHGPLTNWNHFDSAVFACEMKSSKSDSKWNHLC
jgi:hypothetical protein